MVAYADIQDAYDRIRHLVVKTPLLTSDRLNDKLGYRLFVKAEMLQRIGAFKFRGACNAILSMRDKTRPVIAYSSGNHAQAVALVAKLTGHNATIIMPEDAPAAKIEGTRSYGAEVVLYNRYTESREEIGNALAAQSGAELIKPYDDERVIAGQGTIGLEILKSCVSRPLDVIFVCCGGGGMLAGIAAYVKRVRPSVKVIGVEAADAAGMTTSLREGKVVTLDSVGLFADGAAVKTIGQETFRVCNKLVDDMITVTTDQICNAIKLSYNDA